MGDSPFGFVSNFARLWSKLARRAPARRQERARSWAAGYAGGGGAGTGADSEGGDFSCVDARFVRVNEGRRRNKEV